MKAYFDYAATAPVDGRVFMAMQPWLKDRFGNPSSVHSYGREANEALENAREQVLRLLGDNSFGQVIFTSGGTEANVLAIFGAAKARAGQGEIVTSTVEHSSVINSCRSLEKQGYRVHFIPVASDGQLQSQELKKSLNDQTRVVSLQYGGNESGVIFKFSEEVKTLLRENQAFVHIDACQSAGYLDLSELTSFADAITINSTKIYGPQGVGALILARNAQLFPILFGGGQEYGLRSGTQNVPGVVGFGSAVRLVREKRSADVKHVQRMRRIVEDKIASHPKIRINFRQSDRLPHHLSLTIMLSEEKDLVRIFDKAGFAVSSGSACSSQELHASKTLIEYGFSNRESNATVRVSFGRQTAEDEVCKLIDFLLSL